MNSYRATVDGTLASSTLTVIIPVRVEPARMDIMERLDYALLDRQIPRDEFCFCVVDDGSPREARDALRQYCRERGFAYVGLDTELEPFSIARARNVGAMYATSKYVLFQDADLLTCDGFYRDVLQEIHAQRLEEDVARFLMFGVVYLTQAGTRHFFDTAETDRRQVFLQYLFEDDERWIEKVSTGTSVTLFNREYYLARGGNDDEFHSWGFEDHEFLTRCMLRAGLFPEPRDFLLDYKNFRTISEFRGWRSAYRLLGDLTFMKGQVLFHSWHPVDVASDYAKGRARNEQLFHRKLREYVDEGTEPEPLPSLCEGRTLLFSVTNPFVYNREVLPRLGEVVVEDETRFTPSSLLELIRTDGISRVLFHNPYATPQRLALYRAIREAGIPYLVAERGALRDSVFFDPDGFNADSRSYAPESWDRELTDERRASVERYIREERARDDSLEKQSDRMGRRKTVRALGVHRDKKVLFVPLQRPSDTVIQYFCGPIGSYEAFLRLVADVTRSLGPRWKVVVKKHPLEDDTPEIPGTVQADAYNVKDLLDVCDAVLLINSGVGVLGMLWEKPVLYAGEAFYAHPDINRQVSTADEVVRALRSGFRPDRERSFRFLSYLLHDFYSFGTFTTREIPWKDGGRMTVTGAIDFYQIRNVGRSDYNRQLETAPRIPSSSVIFDRYRLDLSRLPSAQGARTTGAAARRRKRFARPRRSNLRIVRRWRKLRQSPDRFFSDSKWRVLRSLGAALYSDES